MMHADNKPPVLLKKLVWLIVIWTVSVLALGGVSMIFRALMTAAGLKSIIVRAPSGSGVRMALLKEKLY